MNIFQTNLGAEIHQLPIHEFPGLTGNVYVAVFGKYRVLIDTGSGFGESNHDLNKGFEEIGRSRNKAFAFNDLSHIFITHGHIDHFGGLPYLKERTAAEVYIHELDRGIVANHEERLSLAAQRLEDYLIEAGVTKDQREKELEMYKMTKSVYRSVKIDRTFEAIGMRLGPFQFTHVPGHTAGHVMIRLHDALFSGDHILERTSPHQAPEQITLSTGLETYLSSLEKSRKLSKKVNFTLGGHGNPISNLDRRIDEIKLVHLERLSKVLNFLVKPHTIAELSFYLFGTVEGYTVLLALEEAGAHVEYLYQRGFLKISNLPEVEDSPRLVAKRYQCIECRIDHI